MTRTSWLASLSVAIGLVLTAGATPGCNCDHNGGKGNGDMGIFSTDGGLMNPCGENADPNCMIGGPGRGDGGLPLTGDADAGTVINTGGVGKDPMGNIILNSTSATFDYMWVADDTNYGIGLMSKIDTRPRANAPAGAVNGKYREVARYLTVTCKSNDKSTWAINNVSKVNPTLVNRPVAADTLNAGAIGSGPGLAFGECTGGMGCCDVAQKTPVQIQWNRPSRTAVDFNGDVWVANRAIFDPNPYYQASVTRIANKNNSNIDTDCIDRNGNGVIETSSDVNDDGIIDTDCNNDNVPDDAATVCAAGHSKEFWGLDDECILFTTNIGPPGRPANVTGVTPSGGGRPLALGPGGGGELGPSDAWVGLFYEGTFYRVDGRNGSIKGAPVQLKITGGTAGEVPHPYGAAIDASGILWAPLRGQSQPAVAYFDTENPANMGTLILPTTPNEPYGVTVDGFVDPTTGKANQQLWVGITGEAGAVRFRPNRTGTFADLQKPPAALTHFVIPPVAPDTDIRQGRGIAVDNRMPRSFAWVALDNGFMGRIPIDAAPGDPMIGYKATTQPGTLGAGVARDLDVWGVNRNTATVTHFPIDTNGNFGAPDQVKLDDNAIPGQPMRAHTFPYPYTYSDFTGFGLRNFTNPRGFYQWTEAGCGPGMTQWLKVTWDADVPAGTKLTMRARSSDSLTTIAQAPWTGDYEQSPADLSMAPGPLDPNPSGYLQVEFDFTTTTKSSTPVLKGFSISHVCVAIQR